MNTTELRKDFPILSRQVNGCDLVYFDNGATTQKPQQVIDCLTNYYSHINSNVHRGVHSLSQMATEAMEAARLRVQQLIHARESEEIIFTKGTTESINLVAQSFGQRFVNSGDAVVITTLEHHANLVPWQQMCLRQGAHLKVWPILRDGSFDLSTLDNYLTPDVKILAIAHISNVLGSIAPLAEIIERAHARGIAVLVDGAQAIAHEKVDVQALGCDFYVFSGHKMYAPMGVGVLYGKREMLEAIPPYQYGGEMIAEVRFEQSTFQELPFKFESGTPNVGDILGMESAIQYLQKIGLSEIAAYEHELLAYAYEKLKAMGGIDFYGTSPQKSAVLSFNLQGAHPYDVGTILDQLGIAVRTGHHCAQPLMHFFGIQGTVRASFAFYNTFDEIDRFLLAVQRAKKMLA